MDPLFPEVPEDLSGLSDEDLDNLEREHRDAADKIAADDAEFLKGMGAAEVLTEFERGVEQTEKIVAERQARIEAADTYTEKVKELHARVTPAEEAGETEETAEEGAEPVVAETEGDGDDEGDGDEGDGDEEDAPAEVRELVTAAATESTAGDSQPVRLRRPPAPSPQRQVKDETVEGTHLLPVGELAQGNQEPFTEKSLAEAVIAAAHALRPGHEAGRRWRLPHGRAHGEAGPRRVPVPGGAEAGIGHR